MKLNKLFYILTFLIFLASLNFYVVTNLSKKNNFFVHKVKSLLPQSTRDFLKKFNSEVKDIIFIFDNNKNLKSVIEDKNIKILDILDSIQTFNFTRDVEEFVNNKEYKLTKYTNSLLLEMGPRSYLAFDKQYPICVFAANPMLRAARNMGLSLAQAHRPFPLARHWLAQRATVFPHICIYIYTYILGGNTSWSMNKNTL